MSNFIINDNKGFNMTFANGWSISVQFGPMNYCDNQNDAFGSQLNHKRYTSTTAEIAVLNKNGNLTKIWDDTVKGWCSTDDVAKFIQIVSSVDPNITSDEMTMRLHSLIK
tara:strand:+ start:408 stop:737 length:330 start_codon:yes stop_codon:yes gene_type:complete